SNKGKLIVYDDGGFEYRKYHIDKSGQQLYRCLTYKCVGKAKMINGKLTIYNDHKPVHLPPDHGDEVIFILIYIFNCGNTRFQIRNEDHLLTPCLYAFLSSKTTATYENVFAWL
ncbi:hypothetical protein PMAYCL1PPCAC_04903, partial [Pristionchus mayeri]